MERKRLRDDGDEDGAAALDGSDPSSVALALSAYYADATDTMEQVVEDEDVDAPSEAYGSSYYLQDEYLDSLDRQHHHHGRGNRRTDEDGGKGAPAKEAVDLIVRLDTQPAFFTRGLHGPTTGSSSGARPDSSEADVDDDDDGGSRDGAGVAALLASHLGVGHSAGDLEIIVPVVSESCQLAQSALKGSKELSDLKRTIDSERATREAADTSKSGYVQLLKKELRTGARVEGAGAGTDGPSSRTNAPPQWEGHRNPFATRGVVFDPTRGTVSASFIKQAKRRRAGDRADGQHGDSVEEFVDHEAEDDDDDDDDEEGLRHRILMEQERLAPGPLGHRCGGDADEESLAPAPLGPARPWRGGRGASGRPADAGSGQWQQRRAEKRERIASSVATVTPGSEAHAVILMKQKQLPIYRCKDELLRLIGENAITVVVGETGSGKTTQLVQYLYRQRYAEHGKRIGCTQPRRLAAVGVARRVSEELACPLGSTVGYAIHLDDMTSEDTKIKFMTDGVLLRELVRDPDVNQYSVLLLDEAHERSVDTDVLLGVLKQVVQRRTDLKLIVTSATMDILKFSKFFNHAPYFTIPGQTYEVQVQYPRTHVEDYVAEAVFHVCDLHLRTPLEGKNDILVFMTGRDDVFGTCELIRRRLLDIGEQWLSTLLILPCLSEASTVTGGLGVSVLSEAPSGCRKCVVATNVAETSLTIDGIRYVIDCGFMKTNVFRPKIGMNTLRRYPVSKAQANQRKGRAGRTTEGVCIRLYTEQQYEEEMLSASVPEIQRSSIDSVVLLLKSLGVTRLTDFDFMDPPPEANLRSSLWHLWMLGLLDDEEVITRDGRLALEFPMSPVLAKVLIESAKAGCSHEVMRIIAMITADPKTLFELPRGREEVARQVHGRFFSNESDHLTLLNVLTLFVEAGKTRQWAKEHYLNITVLSRALDVLQQLTERMRRLELPIESCGTGNTEAVRECLSRGLFLQSARRSGTNWSEYRLLLNAGVTCFVHPSSAVSSRVDMPPYLLYSDLLLTSKEYIVLVTAVDGEWLAKHSRGLFRVKGQKYVPPPPPAPDVKPTATAVAARPSVPTATTAPHRTGGPPPPARPMPLATPTASKGFAFGRKRPNI